eukprot:evm.model.NODE_15034_length_10610_cov_53.885864.1
MGEDDDPQALLATFDKCRRRGDGTVDTNTLVHWLRLEVDAPGFVQRLESLGKASYTRAEFERLLLHGAAEGSSGGTKISPESRGMGGDTFYTSTTRNKQERKQRPSSPRRERLVEEEVESPHAEEHPPSSDAHGPKQTRQITNTATKSTTKHHHHHRHHQGEGEVDYKSRKEVRISTTPPRPLSASPERTFSTHFLPSPDRSRTQRDIERGGRARLVKRQQQQQHASSKWSLDQEQDEYPCHTSGSQSEYSSSSSSSSSNEDEDEAKGGYRHHRHDYYYQHHRKPSSSTSRRRDARSRHRSPGPSLNNSYFLSPQLTQGIRDFFRLGVGNDTSSTSTSSSSRSSRRGYRRGAAGRDQESDVEAAQDGRRRGAVISRKEHGSWTEALAKSRLLNGEKGGRDGGGSGASSSSRKAPRRGHSRSHRHRDHRSTSPPPHQSSTGKYSSHNKQQERQPASSTHHTFLGFPRTTKGTNLSRSPISSRRQRRTNDHEEGKQDGSFQSSITRSSTLCNPAPDSGSPAALDQSLPLGGRLVPRDSEAASLITGHTYWRKDSGESDGQALLSRTVDPALGAVMDGLDHLSGTARPHLQGLLQTAQDHAASALANENRAQNRVLLEGNVELWSPSRILGSLYKSWVPFHLVLYAGTKEIRLYQSSIPSAWGIIPLHEKGTLELRLLEKIECPTDAQWGGRRFDLIVRASSGAAVDAKYPGLGVYPGDEDRTTHTARYNFRAPTAENRLLWVSLITAVLDSCSAPPSSSSGERNLTLAPHDPAPTSFSLPCQTPDEVTLLSPPVSSTATAMSTTSSAALARDGVGLGESGDTLNMTSRAPLRATYSSSSATASGNLPGGNVKVRATHHMSSPGSPPRGGAGRAPVGGR